LTEKSSIDRKKTYLQMGGKYRNQNIGPKTILFPAPENYCLPLSHDTPIFTAHTSVCLNVCPFLDTVFKYILIF
jgi:hypothetical protein